MFWFICLLLALGAAVFVVWPIWRNRPQALASVSRDETQVQLYREHLEDLEAARARGEVSEAEYKELELELQQTLVAETDPARGPSVASGGSKVLWLGALAVPLVGFFGYGLWGAKTDWDIYTFMETIPKAESPEEYQRKMTQLVERVSDRVQERPDNTQYHNLLAQAASAMGDHKRAAAAYRAMLEEFPDQPMLLARLAQSSFYAAGNSVTPEVRDYVKRALAKAPMLPDMHALAGIDAHNQGDYAAAIRHWQTALSVTPADSAAARGYRAGIEKSRAAMAAAGLKPPVTPGPNAQATASAAVNANAGAQNSSASASASATSANGGDLAATGSNAAVAADSDTAPAATALPVAVRLADGVKVPADAAVFIYARAWQGAKMPLAIARLTVGELPATVTLTEAMAMAPGMTLKSVPQLEVVARISTSGNAIAQPGDWQATFGPVSLADAKAPIDLVVAERLP